MAVLASGCTSQPSESDGAEASDLETIYTHRWSYGPGYGGGTSLPVFEDTFDVSTSLVSEWELSGEGNETIVTYRARFEPDEGTPAQAVAEQLGGTAEFLVQALKTYVETGKVLEPPQE